MKIRAVIELLYEICKLIPIIVKHIEPLWEEIKIKYDKKKVEEFNRLIDKCMKIEGEE